MTRETVDIETPALRAIIFIFGIFLLPFKLDYIGKHFPVNKKTREMFSRIAKKPPGTSWAELFVVFLFLLLF